MKQTKVIFKNFLDNKNCLKIICGAGNKDLKEITNICALYASAGCRFFDLNASVEAIKAAKAGIQYANKLNDCFLCVSVGTKDDPHFLKCSINKDKCTDCGNCASNCIQNAITKVGNRYSVNKDKCIGCGKCENLCPVGDIQCHDGKPVWLHNGKCMTCYACLHHCPSNAISWGWFTSGKGQYVRKVK